MHTCRLRELHAVDALFDVEQIHACYIRWHGCFLREVIVGQTYHKDGDICVTSIKLDSLIILNFKEEHHHGWLLASYIIIFFFEYR
jgi:hypothetical protein